MGIFQMILVWVFGAAVLLVGTGHKRCPERVKKLLPYNYLIVGGASCYLSIRVDNDSAFLLGCGIVFLACGVFLLVKRGKERKS